MTEIISVRFKEGGKAYYFNPNGLTIAPGEQVIIETSRGMELGSCVEGNRFIDEMELVSPLRPVVRKATKADLKTLEQNKEKEKRAFQICQRKIQEHGLEMKLVEVEYNFDGSKILFFFTSEGRVDFRALVRDLAGVFHTRIELRQIGVRDEAKMLGGLGGCGRPYCCSTFLNDFHPVSIKMAKTQSLSLNPTKISGACGRLMCCLKYEQEAYEDVLKRTPKLESLVETPDGVGTVNAVQMLREKVKVRLDDDPDKPRVYSNSEITVIRSGKGKRPEGYELPDPAERAQRLQALHLRDAAKRAQAAAAAPQAQPGGASPLAAPEGGEKGEKGGGEKGEKRRRHRSRRRGSGSGAQGQGGKPEAARQSPQRPAPQAAQPGQGEGGEKGEKRRRRRSRRRGPRPQGEGGAPKNQE